VRCGIPELHLIDSTPFPLKATPKNRHVASVSMCEMKNNTIAWRR
jgi:hypothetical protein